MRGKYYRSCSSSEDLREDVVVYDNEALVVVTIFGTFVSCGNILKAGIDKMLLTIINKKVPINKIISLPQDIMYRATQADVYSSVVSRRSKVSDSSSLTLSICRRGGRKPGVKNRMKVQRFIDDIFNCRNPNQQLLNLKEVLWNPNISKTNKLISSSTSNSSSDTLTHSPRLFDLMKQYKTSRCRGRRTLISKLGVYGNIDFNAFCENSIGIKSKSRATNSIIEPVWNINYHKQQCLTLNDTLVHPKLTNQATGCGYFLRESEKDSMLKNMEQ